MFRSALVSAQPHNITMQDCSHELGQIDLHGPKSNNILLETILPHLFNPSLPSSMLLHQLLRIDRPGAIPPTFSMKLSYKTPVVRAAAAATTTMGRMDHHPPFFPKRIDGWPPTESRQFRTAFTMLKGRTVNVFKATNAP